MINYTIIILSSVFYCSITEITINFNIASSFFFYEILFIPWPSFENVYYVFSLIKIQEISHNKKSSEFLTRIRRCLSIHITNCNTVVINVKTFFRSFGSQYWPGNHCLNKLKFTLYMLAYLYKKSKHCSSLRGSL